MGALIDPLGTIAAAPARTRATGNPFAAAYLALLFFLLVYCTRPEDWIPLLSRVPLAKIAALSAFLAIIFSLGRIRKHFPREITYLALLIAQLLGASALSPVWRGGAIATTLDFAKVLLIVIVIAVTVDSLHRLRRLILIQAASAAAIAAATLWHGHSRLGRLDGMLGGNYGDPNDLALVFVVSLPLCLALLLMSRRWAGRIAWTAAIVLQTITIFLTGSRGGFLAFAATATVSLWSFGIRGRRRYLAGMAAVLIASAALSSGGIVLGRLRATFNGQNDSSAAYDSARARTELFWRSVEVTREHPIFGVGPGNFAQVSGAWHVAHNSFLQMSSEGGIPALMLYILILRRAFQNIGKAKRLAHRKKETLLFAKALHGSLIGYVVGSCFLTLNYAFFPYFLAAYAMALCSVAKNSAEAAASRENSSAGVCGDESQAPLAAVTHSPAWAR